MRPDSYSLAQVYDILREGALSGKIYYLFFDRTNGCAYCIVA